MNKLWRLNASKKLELKDRVRNRVGEKLPTESSAEYEKRANASLTAIDKADLESIRKNEDILRDYEKDEYVARYSDGGENTIQVIQSKSAFRSFGDNHASLRYNSSGKWRIGAGRGGTVSELVKDQVSNGIQRKKFKDIKLTHGEDIFGLIKAK